MKIKRVKALNEEQSVQYQIINCGTVLTLSSSEALKVFKVLEEEFYRGHLQCDTDDTKG